MTAAPLLRSRAAAAALAFALLASAGAGRCPADVIDVTFKGTPYGIVTDIVYNNQEINTFAGQYTMQVVGGSSFLSFCVDLADDMHTGLTYPVTPRSTNDGLNAGGEIAYLYNTYGTSPMTDAHQAAGLQMALWELVADGSVHPGDDLAARLASGNFQYHPGLGGFDPNAYGDALTFLTQAETNVSEATWLDSSPGGGALGPKGQGVLMPGKIVTPPVVPGGPTDPTPAVPEPASALVLGLGLAGAATYRRLRRK